MVGAPILGDPIYPAVSTSFAAPIYGSAYVPGVSAGFSGGLYGGGNVYGGGNFYDNNNNGFLGGGLFSQNGGYLSTSIRNDFLGNALEPILPGIGGILDTANDFNLLRRAPTYIDNTFSGQGYRRDPVGSFVRNGLFANQIGDLIPGISASLDAFNRFNLYSSLLN
jgi:hypothetical protein